MKITEGEKSDTFDVMEKTVQHTQQQRWQKRMAITSIQSTHKYPSIHTMSSHV